MELAPVTRRQSFDGDTMSDHTLTFDIEDSSGDDASSKNDADTDADSVHQAARDQIIAVDATPSSNATASSNDGDTPGAAERRGKSSWCRWKRNLGE